MLTSVLFYNFILLSSTALLYISEHDRTPFIRKLCLLLSFLVVFIPNAIRYEIGADYVNYRLIYESINTDSDSLNRLEMGFQLILKLLNSLNLGYEWLFIVSAALFHIFSFKAYPDNRKYIFHFFFITLAYFESFNIIRQVIAMSISMYALKNYNLKNNYFHFFLTIIVAAMFHKIALIMILIPFFTNKLAERILKNFGWGSIFIWLGLLITNIALVTILSMVFSAIPFLDYSAYLAKENYATSEGLSSNNSLINLIYLLIFFYPFLWIKRILKDSPNSLLSFVLLFLYVIFWLFNLSVPIFYRLQQFLFFSFPLVIAIMMNKSINIPYRRLYLSTIIILFMYVFNVKVLNSHTSYTVTCNSGRLAPYVTIFNKEDSQRGARYKEVLCYY